MKLPHRNFLRLAAGATALLAMSRAASAQDYPTRPITIVVPFPAGGPTDALARVLAERMKAALFCGSSRNCGRSHHQRWRKTFDGHAFKSNKPEECVPMSGKIAR
jgi:hypothetical protein